MKNIYNITGAVLISSLIFTGCDKDNYTNEKTSPKTESNTVITTDKKYQTYSLYKVNQAKKK